jgi:hypothetical protein
MYQPYPTSGSEQPVQQRPPVPSSVANAVKLMYAGAVLSLIGVILGLTTTGSLKKAIIKAAANQHKHLTASEIHTAQVFEVVLIVVIGLIGVGLWILIARFSQAGHNWARIVGTILFALDTLLILLNVARLHAITLGQGLSLLTWLVGLGTVILLWRRESSAFFQPPIA